MISTTSTRLFRQQPFNWVSSFLLPLLFLMGVNLLTVIPTRAQTAEQISQIESVVSRTISVPGLPQPEVGKITLEGEYGLANWLMGDAGGMVALIKNPDTEETIEAWQVIRLPGGLPDATSVSQISGIPLDVAESLLARHLQ